MKEYNLLAVYQVEPAHMHQTTIVRASNPALAIKRGLEEIQRREHIRGKSHREISVVVTLRREIPKEYFIQNYNHTFNRWEERTDHGTFTTNKSATDKAVELRKFQGEAYRVRSRDVKN